MDAIRRHLGSGLAVALVAAGLIAPASASAAFANLDAGKLTFNAISGEANNLTAAYSSAGVAKLSDTGHWGPFPILIGGSGGCSGIAALITCSGASSVVINTGDGDDKVAARNGTADRISCGSGNDSVTADQDDSVAADCETVDRGATVGQAAPGDDTAADPTAPSSDPVTPTPVIDAAANTPYVNFQPPVIPRQTVTVSRSGVARVQVVCPVDAGACKGTVALVLVNGSRARARMLTAARRTKRTKGTTIGRARFAAKAGEKPVVQIRLDRRGRRRILRTRHTRCRIVVTTRSAAGKVVTTTREITLRARRGAGRTKKKR